MSNIYVGGISFDTGFSSGFQNTGLNPFLFEINPQSAQVNATTGALVPVGVSHVELQILSPSISEGGSISVNTDVSYLSIKNNDSSVVSDANVSVTPSYVSVTSERSSALVNQTVSVVSVAVSLNQQNPTVAVSSGAIVSCANSYLGVVLSAASVNGHSNYNADVLAASIICNQPTVSTNQHLAVSSNTVAITLDSVTITGASNSVVSSAGISLTSYSPVIEGVAIVQASPLTLTAVLWQPVINDSITIFPVRQFLSIDSLSATVAVSSSVNAYADSMLLCVTIDNPTVSISTSLTTTDAFIGISSDLVSVETSQNIDVTLSHISLNSDSVNVSLGTSVSIASMSIGAALNQVSANGSTNTNVLESAIVVAIIDPEVITGMLVIVDASYYSLALNSATASIPLSAYPDSFNLDISQYDPQLSAASSFQVSACAIEINNDFYIEAGQALPNWMDDGTIDNPFWDKGTACRDREAEMYDCLTTDAFNKVGVPAIWYQIDFSTNNEKIMGEDNDRCITRNYAVQYYADSLPTDDKVWSKWGIEGMDKFHIFITKTHFAAASQYDLNGNVVDNSQTPKQGDIIKSTHNNVYYDVIEVKDRVEMFLQRSHTWDITLRPMIDQHYSVSNELATDDIVNHINVEDMLAHNDIINIEKEQVMYKDSLPNDPFGLF
jgi:hypothetical protein